jgi:hypothetical protein
MACALQVKQRGCMVARLEHERGGHVDGHGARACGGVGCSACVQGEGVKTGVSVAAHGVSPDISVFVNKLGVYCEHKFEERRDESQRYFEV